MLKEILENTRGSGKEVNSFLGTIEKTNCAVKIDGVTIPNNPKIKDLLVFSKKIEEFRLSSKKFTISYGDKDTLSVVKDWIEKTAPSQYFAMWIQDSPFLKDLLIEISYKK